MESCLTDDGGMPARRPMSRPIGAHFHVPHGLSNAMLLPAVTRFSLAAALPRYAQAARLAGFAALADSDEQAGEKLLAGLEALNAELGLDYDHRTQGTLQLWMVPVAILGVFLVRGIAQFVAQYALARIANEGMLTLRQALFDRVLAAEMGLFGRQSASALSNTVVYEVQTGATLLVQALLGLSRDGFTLVALLVYLLYLNWQLTLIVAVVVPGVAWIMKT